MPTETMKYVLPKILAHPSQDTYRYTTFIETGTCNGDTAAWAANLFDNVSTVEINISKHNHAALKYGDIYNIDFWPGDSRVLLPLILDEQTEPCVFWLDAHFHDDTRLVRVSHECPLREELIAIMAHSWKHQVQHLIFIDDAELFTGDQDQGRPSLEEILALSNAMCGRYLYRIYWGNIILYPCDMDEAVETAVAEQGGLA